MALMAAVATTVAATAAAAVVTALVVVVVVVVVVATIVRPHMMRIITIAVTSHGITVFIFTDATSETLLI